MMKTLLIDDDDFALKLLARQLALLGCNDLTPYPSAREAISRLESSDHGVELVFCDLQMPDIDGVEFVRKMASIGYRGGLVLISGEGARILHTVEKLAQAHGIHVLGTVTKPVMVEQLKQILEKNSLHLIESQGAVQAVSEPRVYRADELEQALDGGQLVNLYQPKVSLSTGNVMGAEALVRWMHPQAGLVYPDQFIPLAETYQLIGRLTSQVLESALGQARRWHDAGLKIKVAVNVSMDNLTELNFPETVEKLLRDSGLVASNLVLEITESRLMLDPRASLDILTRLRLKHIDLSIDDFGTGHSSLAQLRDIPFDELKLDRSFVHGACHDAALKAIIEGTLSMAKQLSLETVAEGVEDQADWNFMRGLGCDLAQGYFIARPMPGGDLPAWCEQWRLRHAEIIAATR